MDRSPSILATMILPIARALRLQGVDPMPIFEQADIDPAMVINADRRIPMAKMRVLWRLIHEATDDEAFGLHAAEQVQPATLHGLGLAVLASSTIYDVLQRLVRFATLLHTGVELKLSERDELVDLDLGLASEFEGQDDIEVDPFGEDFAMGMVVVLCRLTLGEYFSPIESQCRRPTPADPNVFMAMLGCPITFGSPQLRITFVKSDINEQLASANPELARVNDEQTETYLATFTRVSASRAVVGKIVEHLPDGPPSQKAIAEAMHVSNRTLQRKLKEEGTSFIDLLQDARLSLARKYLAQPQRSIVEIAYLLGFSEPSTFSRAFKRWTGQAPAEYRAGLQADSAAT
ncbi:MAG: AraC family transcriptional regulator [Halieaceae bacterium]|jgi:AraC-like DNA-binding protein|nr:AraC family transcriptional regulator [Halieaceae bacterium]